MRWRSAFYFAFIPTLLMIFLEGSYIHEKSPNGHIYWHWKILEPMLFCTPICLLMAATGYAIAIRCLTRPVSSALFLGGAVGIGWALVVLIAGNTLAQLTGATPLTLDRVAKQVPVLLSIFVPIAVIMCLFTRWRGRRLNIDKSPG